VVWVDGGEIRMTGSAHEVVSAYESAMSRGERASKQLDRRSGSKGRFLRWEIVDPGSEEPHTLTSLATTTIRFTIEVNEPIRSGHHGIALFSHDRQLIWASAADNVKLEAGEHELRYTFPMLPLRPGPYTWQVSLYEQGTQIDAWDGVPEMIVATEIHQHPSDEWNGILNIPAQLEIRTVSELGEKLDIR